MIAAWPDAVLAIHNPAGGTGGDYYPLFDGLGSTTHLTDASGNVVDSFTYTPYGQATVSGSVTDPIQYAGGYDDNASGNENLTKFGQRYLDPSTGRWTQIDPVNDPLDQHGWNQYNYAGDDPVNNTDKSGSCSILDWIVLPIICGMQEETPRQSTTITFGHGGRHLSAVGLTQGEVESAIEADIRAKYSFARPPEHTLLKPVIDISGVEVEYHLYYLGNGRFNVGTYFPV